MLTIQYSINAKSFARFCLSAVSFMLVVSIPGHAQIKHTADRSTLSRPEYVISNEAAVWRVQADGSLDNYDYGGTGGTSTFYHYAYGPSLLRVSPDGSMVFAGGEQALMRDAVRKVFIEAYRLSPQGRFRLVDTFAHEPSGDMPYALAFGTGGRFLYVIALRGSDTKHPFSALSSYRVSRGGRITRLPIPEQRIGVAGPNKANMISDPQGSFIYITQPQNRTIAVYRVTTNGSLKALPPSPVSLSQTPSRLICPSTGPFLYVVSAKDNSLTQLRRDKDGTLHMTHFFRFGKVNPERAVDPVLAITPNGRFLYVGDDTRPVTQQYTIEPEGTLKALSPPTAAFSPESISVDLTNRFAYLVDTGETNERLICPYRISPSGTLIRIKGNPAATAGNVSLTFARPR